MEFVESADVDTLRKIDEAYREAIDTVVSTLKNGTNDLLTIASLESIQAVVGEKGVEAIVDHMRTTRGVVQEHIKKKEQAQ